VIKLVRKDGKFPIRLITVYPTFIHGIIQIEKKENNNWRICGGNLQQS